MNTNWKPASPSILVWLNPARFLLTFSAVSPQASWLRKTVSSAWLVALEWASNAGSYHARDIVSRQPKQPSGLSTNCNDKVLKSLTVPKPITRSPDHA
jgi:hypothetical protein